MPITSDHAGEILQTSTIVVFTRHPDRLTSAPIVVN